MGWCHEFGVTVQEGCSHPMTAGESSCQCDVCGFVCEGRFAGCPAVWADGPREVVVSAPTVAQAASQRLALITPPAREQVTETAPSPATEEARGQMLEWLEDCFDGVRSQLRVLTDAVDRQQQALAALDDAADAARGFAEVTDVLPERIGEAIREVIAVEGRGLSAEHVAQEMAAQASARRVEINRDGWQDRLRALRPAGSRSAG